MSLAYDIAKAVSTKEPKESGPGYLMNCPGHDDKEMSAWIADNPSGIPSVKCYKSCDKHQIINGIKSKAPGRWPEFRGKEDKGVFHGQWDYKHPDGSISLRVKRFDKRDGGKDVMPFLPLPGGDFKAGRRGWVPIMFNLPDLIARRNDSVVCDVEGEPKAAVMMENGILTTTAQGGSSAFKLWVESKPEEAVAGCKFVAIIPDHDKAGMKFARQKARHYFKHKIPCKIVTIKEFMPIRERHGLDSKDWFESGKTALELKGRILEAPFFEGEEEDGFEHIFELDPKEERQKVVPINAEAAGQINTETWARDYFVQFLNDDAYYTIEQGWLIWDGKRYKVDRSGQILELVIKAMDQMSMQLAGRAEFIDKWLRQVHMRGKLENIVYLARTKCTKSLNEFNQEKHLYNCWNGVIDCRTGELRPHDKKYLFTKITHVEFDKDAHAPTWMEILCYAMNHDEEMIEFQHRLLGSTLSGSTKDAKVPYFYGEGRNMKSSILEGVLIAHGEWGWSFDKKMFMKNHQESHTENLLHTRDLRYVKTSEIQQGDKLDEAKIKGFSGNEILSGRPFYGKDIENWVNQGKLFLMGNHLASVQGQDIAIWSRLLLVLFPNTISDEEKDQFIKDHNGKEVGDLFREEAKGILAWLVEGCIKWYKSGLQIPQHVITTTKDYKGSMDFVGQWHEAAALPNAESMASASISFQSFIQFLRDGGHKTHTWNETSFGKELAKRYEKKKVNGKNYYIGFSIRSDYMPRRYEESDKSDEP